MICSASECTAPCWTHGGTEKLTPVIPTGNPGEYARKEVSLCVEHQRVLASGSSIKVMVKIDDGGFKFVDCYADPETIRSLRILLGMQQGDSE